MDASLLPIWFAVPFIGMLLSIAILPIIASSFWHSHYGKIAIFWSLIVIVGIYIVFGYKITLHEVGHTYGNHFLPFVILIGSLFILSIGIRVNIEGTPKPTINMSVMAFATIASSFIGTVGSAMIFIGPFLNLNRSRSHKVHSVIFFIFLVCNIGGVLTPIGDPPLFVGYLLGVDFFWPLEQMWKPFLFMTIPLLCIYWIIDSFYFAKEESIAQTKLSIKFSGWPHVILLLISLAFVVVSGFIKSDAKLELIIFDWYIHDFIRDIGLASVAFISYKLSRHKGMTINWAPIQEVALLFAGIFMTAAPVMAMLKAGESGHFSSIIKMMSSSNNEPLSMAYFWVTGILSAFLDNAPTYMIFFNTTGLGVQDLMGPYADVLRAISAGAVFMGAMTYIGNAPNFMVKSLAEIAHIRMPGFFAYMAWSCTFLIPLFVLYSYFFL